MNPYVFYEKINFCFLRTHAVIVSVRTRRNISPQVEISDYTSGTINI